MENKKDSVRVRMTKQLLRRAFTQLLMEKPIQNITVRELCEKAQVNRGTFYVHYKDIFHLLESIEEQMVEELAQMLDGLKGTSADSKSLVEPCRKIFEFLKENSDICIILLGENSDFAFVNRLIQMGKEYTLKQYMKCYPSIGKIQAEYFYSFVSSGCIGLLRQWAASQFRDSSEVIAVMAENLMMGASAALQVPLEAWKE